jgi:membrane protease YdiL (CAAX protease family)
MLILLFYLSLQIVMVGVIDGILGQKTLEASPAASDSGKATTEHAVGQLIAEGNPWFLLLCGISAVIVAPAIEELFFRVLLQGWLETVELRWRRYQWMQRWRMPQGIISIVPTALLFASMHFRTSSPKMDVRDLVIQQGVFIISSLLALVFAVMVLRYHVGATAADLGWTPGKTIADVKLGLRTFLAIAAPLYAMQFGLQYMLSESTAPDPLPLFFFAIVLGILYYRTHRITSVFMLHAALNSVSLAMAWFLTVGKEIPIK